MDPSSSSQSQVLVKSKQTKDITCMDCDSYNAAAEGKIKVFKKIITNHQSLDLLLTPNKNTVLHIYITALNSKSKSTTPIAGSESTTFNAESKSTTTFVKKILKMCSKLLKKANTKGETPLHIAARYGHDDIVEVLIEYCAKTLDEDPEGGIGPAVKEMLRMVNKKNDTALHEAVRYNHLKVVQLLIITDLDFSYSANDAGETPLYIAAERGFKDVVIEILDKCKSLTYKGPLGRTVLHAAIIREDQGMIKKILDKIEGISKIADNDGWTPLHFAAYFDSYYVIELVLIKDRDVAYLKDTKGRTALHIAASKGYYRAVTRILALCPDCCELVDNRGWNVLHFAFKGARFVLLERTIEIFIKNSSFSNLLNEKNADGDTPLHFYSSTMRSAAKNFVGHPRVDKMAFNQKNESAWDIASANFEKFSKEKLSNIRETMRDLPRRVIAYEDDDSTKREEMEKEIEKDKKKWEKERISILQKASEVHLVVGALITTVSFAACITMPGGFVGSGDHGSSHPGSALLRKNVAFTAFIITDTISLVLSSSAVFIHLLMPFLFNDEFDKDKIEKLLFMAFRFILWAMIAMVLAFVTGTYVVLLPSSGLAILNCIIGLTFLAILLFVFLKCIDEPFYEVLFLIVGKFVDM